MSPNDHVAYIELGDQWDVHFSPDLIKDIKTLGHGIVWSWGVGSGDGIDAFEEILF
ncbi:MAG TPA: hypothetical protein VJT81_01710 [Burkholderiales bacterium]|nr:hypothetical protein [Burkholderiales bacterium]